MQCLHTERLVLEPQCAGHAEAMFGVLCDPALYQHEGEAPASVDWLRARFARLETRQSPDGREGWLNWVLRLRSTGELTGYVQATVYSGHAADVAYVLASQHWGRGLATEAVAAMLHELTQAFQVQRLSALLKTSNERSRRLLLRLGFAPAADDLAAQRSLEAGEMLMVRNTASAWRPACNEPAP